MKKLLATAVLFVFAIGLLGGCSGAQDKYAWVLVETTGNAEKVAYEREDKVSNSYPHAWAEKIEASENGLIRSRTYLGTNYADHDDVHILAHHVEGNHITRKLTWSTPPATLGPDEKVAIQIKIETLDQGAGATIPLSMKASAGTRLYQGDKPTSSTFFVDNNGNEEVSSSEDNDYAAVDTTLYGKMGKGEQDGELRAVWANSYVGGAPYTNLYVMYTYKWQKK